MGSSPSPPPAPDPYATAQAQTGENIGTATANAALQNINQTDQFGNSINYSVNGSTPVDIAGTTYQIPQYSEHTTLSPAEQQLYTTTLGAQQNVANDALQLSANAGQALSTPLSLQDVSLNSNLSLPTSGYNTSLNGASLPVANLSANNINRYINTSWEQPFDNLAAQEQEQLNQQLASQGIMMGGSGGGAGPGGAGGTGNAYQNAEYNLGQELQGQQDTYANAMYGTAANAILAQAQEADSNILNADQLNTNAQTSMDNALLAQNAANNNALLSQAGFNNQTALTQQETPLNELNSMLGLSQVAPTSFINAPVSSTTIPTTDFAQIQQNSYQDQLAAYNAQVQNESANTGGLFGLGGSILGGLVKTAPAAGLGLGLFSDRRLKTAIRRIGELANGLPVYAFRYIWSPVEQIGLMADEVARVHPEAVFEGPAGFATVNYEMAVK